MLAQNFKTPADLGIKDVEFEALVKVLGMLERGELREAPKPNRTWDHHTFKGMGFNMECSGVKNACGTVACIGGWAAYLMGRPMNEYVNYHYSTPLENLFWGNTNEETSISQAAIALRNFLTHGEPRWAEALAD